VVLPARPLRSSFVVLAIVLALAIVAAIGLRPASASTVSVDGGNNYFCSGAFDGGICETDVTAGDTVTWTIVGGMHTVTLCNDDFSECPPAAGGWDSGLISKNAVYSQTFASPGTYAYRCELHPSEMKGKIVVAAVTPSPTPVATAEPTNAPVAASATTTPVALPQTGGAPDNGVNVSLIVSLGLALLAGAALAFTLARRRA
jgi:hypothetical protein